MPSRVPGLFLDEEKQQGGDARQAQRKIEGRSSARLVPKECRR